VFAELLPAHLDTVIGTYTGHYEDVKGLSDLLDQYERRTGYSIPIHGRRFSNMFNTVF